MPDIPGMPSPQAPRRLANTPPPDPALIRTIQGENPDWSPARVLQAALDPDIARGYRTGVLGDRGVTPPPESVTPRQIETLRQGVQDLGRPAQGARMQQLLDQVDPLVDGYKDARGLAARKYTLQELLDNPQPGLGSLARSAIGVGQTKAAGMLKILNALRANGELSPPAEALRRQITAATRGAPLPDAVAALFQGNTDPLTGRAVGALSDAGWRLPAGAVAAGARVPGRDNGGGEP